jgi:hypothetical protein
MNDGGMMIDRYYIMPLKIQINLYTLFIWNLEIMSEESSSSELPVVGPDASVNLALYGTASLIYLFLNFRSPDQLSVKILYLVVVMVLNGLLIWWLMTQQCMNPNIGWAFGAPILIWFFLFVPMFWLLEYMYVWLQPFGNTFGYLFIKLMGVTTFMDKILKPSRTEGAENNRRINKYINYIRSDPWGFFSMLTVNTAAEPDILRADKAFEELSDKLKEGQNTDENKNIFVGYVRMKESVAKLVFYLLTLNLMTDITAVFIMQQSPCEVVDTDDVVSKPPPSKGNKSTTEYKSSE